MDLPKSLPSTAPGWIRWHDWNAGVMRPLADWVCRAAALSPGQRVLDVASGTGVPALAVAARVGLEGRVVATDVDPGMLAALQTNARAAGLSNVELREMPSERLDFPDASFDAVTYTFGLMFSRDPARSLAEIARVLRPGGRAAISVWAEVADNPFFATVFQTVGRFFTLPPKGPDAPGPFRFAAPGKLEVLLGAAGFAEVSIEPLTIPFAFDSIEHHWQVVADMTPHVKAVATTLPEAELRPWKDALAEAVRPFVSADGRVAVPATARVATVRR